MFCDVYVPYALFLIFSSLGKAVFHDCGISMVSSLIFARVR